MLLDAYQAVYERLPLFAGIPQDRLVSLISDLGAVLRRYDKGRTILGEGGPAHDIGVILSGSVQVEQHDYYGNRSIVGTFTAGSIFAEAFACAGVEILPVSVVSLTESDILLMDCRRILAGSGPDELLLQRNLLAIVARKNLLLNRKLHTLSSRTTRDKLLSYLSDQAKAQHSSSFTIPYDRQELADYLCVERSAMSAELGKLVREGILTTHRSRFTLLTDIASSAADLPSSGPEPE